MRPNRWMSMVAIALAGTLLAACGGDDGDSERSTQTTVTGTPPVAVDMVAADGSPVGRVTFVETDGRVTVDASLTNLPPGIHAFHVHAVGRCESGSPAFTSAGGHMVIGDQTHPAHAGDQPVLLVMADGSAEMRFATDRYKLSDLLVPGGRAIIVHANADNYANVPNRYVRQPDATTKATGDAGDRIACGVIGDGGPATDTTESAAAATSTTSSRPTSSTAAPSTSRQAAATTTTRVTRTLDCQPVPFTPNSEDLASDIKATGLTCAEAEAFVRIAGRQTSSGGPAELDVEGYRCVRVRSVQDPLPRAFYECTSGARKVTFVRS